MRHDSYYYYTPLSSFEFNVLELYLSCSDFFSHTSYHGVRKKQKGTHYYYWKQPCFVVLAHTV